jgi:hypothetical protein
LNFATSADLFIRRSSWNFQCDTFQPVHEQWRMVLQETEYVCPNEKTMDETEIGRSITNVWVLFRLNWISLIIN